MRVLLRLIAMPFKASITVTAVEESSPESREEKRERRGERRGKNLSKEIQINITYVTDKMLEYAIRP
jgi:hypothetical protein